MKDPSPGKRRVDEVCQVHQTYQATVQLTYVHDRCFVNMNYTIHARIIQHFVET